MRDCKEILVSPETTIRETLRVIDEGSLQIALVVNRNGRLVGTVTDGDVRRAILRNVPVDAAVCTIMNTSPTTALVQDSIEDVVAAMTRRQLRHMPIVDSQGSIMGIEVLREFFEARERPNWVVLMAGGYGLRLRPLTEDCPKPLLKVGTRPLLETILSNFVSSGFRHFFISVHYRAEMVKDHFEDGSRWGVTIQYIDEKEQGGTAGALSLLPGVPEHPVFVMNGDVLTKVHLDHVLDFHEQQASEATMCVREYEYQVPYGVVTIGQHDILTIEEKPVQRFLVNAGIYVLNPAVLQIVPRGESCDMTSLFQLAVSKGLRTSVFPIREYWLDIGQMDDFQRANSEFVERFP